MESAKLSELPTLDNSNTKKELALLKNILYGEETESEQKIKSTSEETCSRTRLQDLWLVLVAMGLFLILGNPWTLKIFSLLTGNAFLSFVLSILIFGGFLYLIYVFMP